MSGAGKTKYFIVICLLAALTLSLSLFVSADSGFYVNSADFRLPQYFDGVFAVGSGGAEMLMTDELYALSADGLQKLGSAVSSGGGGLSYENGTIAIRSDRIRVGLFYRFSELRDTSVKTSVLENMSGSGFSFGTYGESGEYTEITSTDFSRIMIVPGEGSAVFVAAADSGDPICGLDSTGRAQYLTVRPLPGADGSEPLTSCAGNKYCGEFGYAVLGNAALTVVNELDIESYVMGVCACEMGEGWPIEALKAQAVAARTYAQRMIHSSVYHYSCGFDVTADTYCQAYRGTRGVGDTIREAVTATANTYLTCDGQLIDAVYSAADGGATEDSINVFGSDTRYLVGVFDPYEAAAASENPYAYWKVTMTPTQLGNRVGIDAVRTATATTSRTGNVIRLELTSVSGQTAVLIRDNCRIMLDLRNIRYTITQDSAGNFVFTGSGYGHNLGMSQWGAYAMARYYGKDYRFILGFYYTGVRLCDGVPA